MTRFLSLTAMLVTASVASAQPIDDARNVSGLLGKTLAPADDIAAQVTDLLLSRNKGKVRSVTVLDDAEGAVTLEIAFEGLEAAPCKLSVRAKDAASGDVGAIPEVSARVQGPSGTVRVTLALRGGLPEGTTAESARIRIEVRRGSGVKYETSRWFAMAKRWSSAVLPENVVVRATPVPVGTIPATAPSATRPPILIRPDALRMLQLDATRVAPEAAAAPRIGRLDAPTRVRIVPGAAAEPAPAAGPRTIRTLPMVTKVAPLSEKMVRLKPLPKVDAAAGLPKAVTDKNGRGPSNRPLPWFDGIRAPQGLSLTAAKVTTIDSTVYQDANPASGIWYYLPARFVVSWDPDNGHAVRITYGTPSGDKQPVYLSARLTAGIDSSEVELVRNLLRAQLQASGVPFTELRPLPFQDAPKASFKGELGQFDVPPEAVSVTSISDVAGEIELSLATDPVTTAVLQTTLTEGLGLPGNLAFVAAGPEAFTRTVPVTLRAPDVRSYRTLAWKRGAPLRNRTPFPLLVRNLHFLTIGPDGTPTVYSYAFSDAVVPPRAQLRVQDDAVVPWLDGALKAWIEYAVKEAEPAGLSAVRDEIGIAAAQATSQATFETLTPFTAGGLARIVLDVRSSYFDPRDRDPRVRTVQFSKDGERASVGPLFLGDRSPDDLARPGDPLFSWRVSVVKADGTVAGPGPWTDGSRLELFIGNAQLQPLLGTPAPNP